MQLDCKHVARTDSPRKKRKCRTGWQPVLLLLLALALLIACTGPAADAGPLTAVGFLEAEELALAPAVGGRVIALPLEVGDEVEAGDLIAQLDDRIAQAQVALAAARVAEAEAQLDWARNGATAAEIAVAEAQLAQAEAGRAGACGAWSDLQTIVENPQELDRQIAQARALVRAAEAGVRAAEAGKDAAALALSLYEDAQVALADAPERITLYDGDIGGLPIDLPPALLDFLEGNPADGVYRFGDTEIIIAGRHITLYRYLNLGLQADTHFIPNQYWQAWITLNSVSAERAGAQEALNLLYALRENPQALLAQVAAAEAQCRQTEALTAMAEAGLDALQQGATAEELAALEALLAREQAELQQAEVTLARQTLHAPVGGVVLERVLEVGELAAPSIPLVRIADLDTVYLTLYLPTRQLGRIRLGQAVEVRVPGFADHVFEGEVIYISPEAEFPPRAVPQDEERGGLVFAVHVRIANTARLLKPGMPADAAFIP